MESNLKLVKRYWDNEQEIRAIELSSTLAIDAIVDDPSLVSETTLDKIEILLEEKQSLLLLLAREEQREVSESNVPDLMRYRQLVSCVSAEA